MPHWEGGAQTTHEKLIDEAMAQIYAKARAVRFNLLRVPESPERMADVEFLNAVEKWIKAG